MRFEVGKIYYTAYSRAHQDRNPLLLVLHSDNYYTHGINIRYIGSVQQIQLANTIKKLHNAGLRYSGQLLYATLKKYVPQALGRGLGYHGPRGGVTNPRYNSYRTYFTAFLQGVEVHPGVNKFPSAMFDAYQKAREKILQNSILKKQAQRDHFTLNFTGGLPQRKKLIDSMRGYSNRFKHLFNNPAVIDQQQDNLGQPSNVPPGTTPGTTPGTGPAGPGTTPGAGPGTGPVGPGGI